MRQRYGIRWLRGTSTSTAYHIAIPLHVHATWTSGTPKAAVLAWLDEHLRALRKRQPHAAIKVTLHRTHRAEESWQKWIVASWSGYLWGMRDELAMAIEGLLRREAIALSLEPTHVQCSPMASFDAA